MTHTESFYATTNPAVDTRIAIAKIESSSVTCFFFIFLLFVFFYTSAIKFRMYVIKLLIVDINIIIYVI
nr:hypothetical protein BSM_32690 [uncultured archaeon]